MVIVRAENEPPSIRCFVDDVVVGLFAANRPVLAGPIDAVVAIVLVVNNAPVFGVCC